MFRSDSPTRTKNVKATTPQKRTPPLHSPAASGTLPTEQTKEITATIGPISGPTTLDQTGSCDRNRLVQNAFGTQAASAPAISRPPTISIHMLAQSIT